MYDDQIAMRNAAQHPNTLDNKQLNIETHTTRSQKIEVEIKIGQSKMKRSKVKGYFTVTSVRNTHNNKVQRTRPLSASHLSSPDRAEGIGIVLYVWAVREVGPVSRGE